MEAAPNQSQILEDYINQREKEDAEETTKKKAYLKENILDVYIKEEEQIDRFLEFFLVYLRKNKGIDTQEHNLDLLSMEELKELVAEFRALHPSQAKEVEIENSLDVSLSVIEPLPPHNEGFDAQKMLIQSNGSWDYELEGYEECKHVKPFFSVEDDCRNIVVIFEKQEVRKTGGFFGIGCKSELWIQMRTNLFKEYSTRRIEDFLTLRAWLTKCFPYVFICPLEITDKQLQKVGDESVRAQLVVECRRFINFVVKNQLLLQCFYTHRFFKEKDYQSFSNGRKEELATRIKNLQNTEGCFPIEISDRNELLKKDYSKKSQQLEKLWNRLDDFNSRIANKLKEVHGQIQRQRKEMERMILQFTNVNPMLKSKVYDTVTGTLIAYGELFKNCEENIGNLHFLFESLNLQVAAQAKKTWGHFTHYAKDIIEVCQEYHARRKVFLEKEAQRMEGNKEKTQKQPSQSKQPQLDPVNRSIISSLGISNNNIKETAWIQRYSKWQGYINRQFVSSFERLLFVDLNTLRKILQENIVRRQQMRRKEEALIKSLQLAADIL